MAVFIHVADARDAVMIRRNGLAAHSTKITVAGTRTVLRAVYCVPVVADYQATFQWMRELRRRGYRTSVGVQFRIDDNELVFLGKFARPHVRITAAAASGMYLKNPDPRGLQVLIPRPVRAAELMKIRRAPTIVGWRYSPTARSEIFMTRGEYRVRTQNRRRKAALRRKRRAATR
jgi:hypothetical protein